MHDLPKKTLLIIPCYNEEKRLQLHEFITNDGNLHFLFVNDGSSDETSDKIKQLKSSNVSILDLPTNVGKGEAVRQGMIYAQKLKIYTELSWVGYWDADLSTPLSELYNFFSFYAYQTRMIDAIWGSRIYKLGSSIHRSLVRHILGRLFATLIGIIFKIKSYDSQCGAKIFKKQVIEDVFAVPFVSRWIFDIELLLRMHQYHIVECPLDNWQAVRNSKLNILKDAPLIILDIFKVWRVFRKEKIKLINHKRQEARIRGRQ